MNEHERAFVEAFIAPDRRERYLLHLASSKNRRKILDRLNHHLDLRKGIASELTADLTPDSLVAELKRRGIPARCHIIADASDEDGQELPLEDAVSLALMHPFGVILCCVPGRLALYKPESPASLYLLERRAAK